MSRILFVGGPMHGQFLGVEDIHNEYHVSPKPSVPDVAAFLDGRCTLPSIKAPEEIVYRRTGLFSAGKKMYTVFLLEGLSAEEAFDQIFLPPKKTI